MKYNKHLNKLTFFFTIISIFLFHSFAYCAIEIEADFSDSNTKEKFGKPGMPLPSNRQYLLIQIETAHKLYQNNKYKEAAKYFSYLIKHKKFLQEKDLKKPELKDLQAKSQGLVKFRNIWMTYKDKQTIKGLQFYGNKWLSSKTVKEMQLFKSTLTRAKSTEYHMKYILRIQNLLNIYPQTIYKDVSLGMIDQLIEKIQLY